MCFKHCINNYFYDVNEQCSLAFNLSLSPLPSPSVCVFLLPQLSPLVYKRLMVLRQVYNLSNICVCVCSCFLYISWANGFKRVQHKKKTLIISYEAKRRERACTQAYKYIRSKEEKKINRKKNIKLTNILICVFGEEDGEKSN